MTTDKHQDMDKNVTGSPSVADDYELFIHLV